MALQTTGHPTGHPTLSFTPKRKHVITENEWAAAWDDFLAVYLGQIPPWKWLICLPMGSRSKRWHVNLLAVPGPQSVWICSRMLCCNQKVPFFSNSTNTTPLTPTHSSANLPLKSPLASATNTTHQLNTVTLTSANTNTTAPSATESTRCTATATLTPNQVRAVRLPTPLHPNTLNQLLQGYPNREQKLEGFRHGFMINFDGPDLETLSKIFQTALLNPKFLERSSKNYTQVILLVHLINQNCQIFPHVTVCQERPW